MADRKWTKKDDQFLIDNYTSLSMKELADRMNRTKYSISSRIQKLGLSNLHFKKKPWTEVEEQYLRNYGKLYSIEVITAALGRTVRSIRLKLCELNTVKRCKMWSEDDVSYLVKHYGTLKTNVIAQRMGRSLGSIYFKINELKSKGLVNVF